MSCQINNIAHISIIENIKAKLGFIEQSDSSLLDNENEDNWEWEWQEQPSTSSSTQSPPSRDSLWLQKCSVSLSPTGKVLTVAYGKQIVILNAYLDAREQGREIQTEYNIVSHGTVCEPGEEITAVLCVPLLSQLKSSPSGTDWTCIVVGFTSGYVRFYTEDKKLLAAEQLHAEPVNHLKCQSFRRASHSAASEQPEELYVMYQTCVATLPGFSLFQTLRACRNQLARVQASGSGTIEAPPLAHSKWGFSQQEIIKDCQVVGSTSANSFDHLMTASICGGFDAVVKSSAPAHSLVVATGRKPYIGYHYTFEGSSQPILVGVARAMANTIKSSTGLLAIKNYFTGSKTQKEKKPIATIEPAEPMGCRFGLCDLWRQGEAVIPSPNRLLSVVCDSLGRVILLDNHEGIALRMWKGYRDAQCAWIEVKEPVSRTSPATTSRNKYRPRVALFLAVYAPKKGLIEVWAMQQGPKVASFSVSKGGRLLYTNYGHVGVNNVPVKGSSRSQMPCVYVDPSGILKEIIVPFHFSLSAQNRKQARDMHLLKKLRQLLKDCSNDGSVEEVGHIVQDLWSSEAGLQALDLLAGSKNTQPSHMLAALSSLITKVENQDPEAMDYGTKTLQYTCDQLLKLVNFFVFLQDQNRQPPTYESVMTTKNVTNQELANELLTHEKEIEFLITLVSEVASIVQVTPTQPRVKFQDDIESLFTEFLSCFETSSVTANLQRPISVKQDIPEEALKRTSTQVFQGCFRLDANLDEWLSKAQTSGIQAQSFIILSLHFWFQVHQNAFSTTALLNAEMFNFVTLLKGICCLEDKQDTKMECNNMSCCWKTLRNILTNSDRPLRALTAAVVCKGVGIYMERTSEKKEATMSDNAEDAMEVDEPTNVMSTSAEWEQVSMDTMQWNELIKHLEDLAMLDAVLQVKIKSRLRCLNYVLKWKQVSVSLRTILNKGKGAVSELVACWLASTGLEPMMLVETKEDCSTNDQSKSPVNIGKKKKELDFGVEATSVDPDETEVMDLIAKLRRHFPFSLSSNPLIASLFWEYIQDRSQIMNNPNAANTSLQILKAIPSPHLRQGMCNLLWSLYLKQDFEKIARTLNKKTKVQFNDMGIHEGQLPHYVDFCVQFLEAFLEATEESEVDVNMELSCEELWTEYEVPSSLSQVALSKPAANFTLLELHLQLATVLHMEVVCDIKSSSIINNLFDHAGQTAFFCDLSSHPRLPSHNPGFKLTSARTQFLCRVISASVQNIVIVDAGDATEGDNSGPKVDATDAAQWMRKCLILANSWSVNSDTLRRHQICDLYMGGFDRLAEEIISSVNDEAMLGSQLLLIAGQRLQLAIINSSNISEKMSNISPALSTWLQSVEKNNQFCASSIADIEQLVSHIARLLPDNHQDSWLVQLLLDACQHFKSMTDDSLS